MKIIFENKFTKTFLEDDQTLAKNVWQETTLDMSADDFKATLTQVKNTVLKYPINKVLIDATHLLFMIDPDLQEWVAQHITAVYAEAKVQKMATVLPASIFEKVSIQQAIDEHQAEEAIFTRQYFDNEATSLQWLLS